MHATLPRWRCGSDSRRTLEGCAWGSLARATGNTSRTSGVRDRTLQIQPRRRRCGGATAGSCACLLNTFVRWFDPSLRSLMEAPADWRRQLFRKQSSVTALQVQLLPLPLLRVWCSRASTTAFQAVGFGSNPNSRTSGSSNGKIAVFEAVNQRSNRCPEIWYWVV